MDDTSFVADIQTFSPLEEMDLDMPLASSDSMAASDALEEQYIMSHDS